MPSRAGRHHAIEHVDAAPHRLKKIVGRSYAHEIARLVERQMRDHGLDHVEHRRLRLADRQPADRVAVKVHVHERLGAEDAKIFFRAPLDDAEDRPARLLAEGLFRPLGPSEREAHRALGLVMRNGQSHALVELHLDVRAQKTLHLHRSLGRQFVARSVDMRLEGHAALAELAQPGEAHHLKAAGVGEDGMGPVHEFVQAAERRDPLGPGASIR